MAFILQTCSDFPKVFYLILWIFHQLRCTPQFCFWRNALCLELEITHLSCLCSYLHPVPSCSAISLALLTMTYYHLTYLVICSSYPIRMTIFIISHQDGYFLVPWTLSVKPHHLRSIISPLLFGLIYMEESIISYYFPFRYHLLLLLDIFVFITFSVLIIFS